MLPLDPLRFRWPPPRIGGGTPRSSRRPDNRHQRRIEAEHGAEHSTLIDELSQFHSREGFVRASAQWLQRWGRRAPWALLLSLQINHLKVIQHAWGQEVSDRLLIRTALHLREVFRQAAIIGRLGVDEFAVFMRVESPYACSTLLARLSERIDAENSTTGAPTLSVSGVVTQFDPRYAVSIAERLRQAESAMKENDRFSMNT
jgi:diguanylate cyclase (GGDEF)-like protein